MQASRRAEIAKYYDDFLPRLLGDHNGHNARIGNVKAKLAEVLRVPIYQAAVRGEKLKVLDLGCGIGITSCFMASLGADVTAVDISPENIKAAKRLSKHKNVRYMVGDMTDIDIGKQVFDGIVMVDCFEHIPRTETQGVMHTIKTHQHGKTWLYLNIPDERYQVMAQKQMPERLQIVDEAWSLAHLQIAFRHAGMEMMSVDVYGIDVACQYASILFSTRTQIDTDHGSFVNGLEK